MKKRFLLLATLLLIPFSVKAAEGISIECDKTNAAPKSEVHCAFVGYGENIGAVKGRLAVTNGKVTSYEKNICNLGEAHEDWFACIDVYQPTSMKAVTYTIQVGESGSTTVGLTSAEYGLENGQSHENVSVTPVTITIGSTVVNPTPSNPTQPENQTSTTNPTTSTEQKNTKKEIIKNPDTGAFLNITLVLVALGCASYISYRVVKKQKFFRL